MFSRNLRGGITMAVRYKEPSDVPTRSGGANPLLYEHTRRKDTGDLVGAVEWLRE